jgi:hypothetical protein
MKKNLLEISAIVFGIMILILAGCEKTSTTSEPDPMNINSPEKSAITAIQTFDGINSLTDAAFSSNNLKSLKAGECPVITLNISQLPYVVTFDWGTGCTGADGVLRSGKITISLTGKMNVVNSVATFTFQDFYCGGNKLTGIHTITYTGLDTGNNWPRYDIHTEAVITFPDTKTITYNSDNIRLFAAGSDTPLNWSDDVWRIEGTASGKTRSGVNWTATCTSALEKKVACQWFDSGILVVTPEGGTASTVNFGDGTCDNKATVTIGDKTINVEM